GKGLAQDAEDRGRVVVTAGVNLDLAREDDLLQRTGANPLDGAGDGVLVVLGRHGAGDASALRGVGVEQRQRRVEAQVGGAAREASARERAATVLTRPGPAASSSATAPRAPSAAPSRSGCSRQNHGSPARREAAATATGSTPAGSATVTAASASP